MKKTLIALAVLAASTASMAQVTLYGVASVGVTSTNAADRTDGQMFSGGDGGSRWGIRSVEDLGGGMKVTANFEQGLNYETGAQTTLRQATIGLSGGFGTVQMGRTLGPTFWGLAAWELTGAADWTAVGTQFGFGGQADPRNNSQFSYTTPNMGGFSATLGYMTELDVAVAPNSDVSKTDMNAIYAAGPMVVALTYNKLSNADANASLGASYNFGSFTVAGSFQDPAGKAQGWTLGAKMPVGAFSFAVDMAQDTSAEDTDWMATGQYNLSKRTFVYASYLNNGKSSNATYVKTAKSSDTYWLGLRHNF